MSDEAFIFTMDAVLALIPVFILLASISTLEIDTSASFRMLTTERLAQDTLNILEYNGTLLNISVLYQTGVVREDNDLINNAIILLNTTLNNIIPDYLGYRATVTTPRGTFTVTRGNISSAKNIMSVGKTTVGPEQGWIGIAWYKVEKANFTYVNRTSVSTIWNFHNWLSNFYRRPTEWGPYAADIFFSIDNNATIHNAYFILGCGEILRDLGDPYWAEIFFNDVSRYFVTTYTDLGTRPYFHFWNNVTDINPLFLNRGSNSLWIDFTNVYRDNLYYDNMPWFALIANYTVPVPTPENLIVESFNLPDAEGNPVVGTSPEIDWADDDVQWSTLVDTVDDGTPFIINQAESFPSSHGSAISVVRNFTLPSGVTVVDATLNINLYGAVDAARAEVWDNGAGQWVTIFNSFDINGIDYTDCCVTYPDGYGNLPGKLDVDPAYLTPGAVNRIRVTLWDYVPSNDYDWIGIVDSSITVSYTSILTRWSNYPFSSHQDSDNSYYQDKQFEVSTGAQEVLLFVGVGLDSRNLKVEIKNTTSPLRELYNSDIIPYMLNLAELDASLPANQHILTTTTSTPSDYELIPGSYTVRVTVTGPTNNWESGDENSNAEIFSGTKVTVLYPEFIDMLWKEAYSATATEAEEKARRALSDALSSEYGIDVPWNSTAILSESIWASGDPLPTYVKLQIWLEE